RRVVRAESPERRASWHGWLPGPSSARPDDGRVCTSGSGGGRLPLRGDLCARLPRARLRATGAQPRWGIPLRKKGPCAIRPARQPFAVPGPTCGASRNLPPGRVRLKIGGTEGAGAALLSPARNLGVTDRARGMAQGRSLWGDELLGRVGKGKARRFVSAPKGVGEG